jgi:hypothetical protein
MRSDLTDITLVVDRSGSMASVREDAEGGVNTFIRQQAAEPGEALLTLVQFDTEYEFVERGRPVKEVPPYVLQPRGMTALLDAVGRAIVETGQRLAAIDEANRPGLVIFVVMTDGHENSSREFTKARIKEMIEHQQAKYNWQFTFLGANQDAFAEAAALGIGAAGSADFASDKHFVAYAMAGAKVARMRKQRSSEQSVDNNFTDEEREAMK